MRLLVALVSNNEKYNEHKNYSFIGNFCYDDGVEADPMEAFNVLVAFAIFGITYAVLMSVLPIVMPIARSAVVTISAKAKK